MTRRQDASPPWPAAVVFDCDGVLIESVDIKTDAFSELFVDYPEHHEAIVRYHQTHLGISRFAKFAWIYRELLDRELAQEESAALGRRFSELVFERARDCQQVPGAVEAMTALSEASVPLFIASGTPQEELEALISARGWHHFFQGVHGSPRSKPEILQSIAVDLATVPAKIVFIGDGWSDYEAAQRTGVSFVLRETEVQARHFATYRGPRMADLRPLCEYNLDFLDA